MSSIIKQGQGESTEFKVRGLEAAFTINLRIVRGKLPRATYFHFDLNSGSGVNEEVGCKGSPLAFLDASAQVGNDFRAYFVDRDKNAVTSLRNRVGDPRCTVHHGDNAEFARVIPEIIRRAGDRPEFAVGSILADPNGTGIPFAELEMLAKTCPRLDIIMNWNSSIFNRVRLSPVHSSDMSLDKAIRILRKDCWLIREPRSCQKFSLVIGRNVQVGEYPSLGFFRLDSERGQDIFRRLNYTNAERLQLAGQGGLF